MANEPNTPTSSGLAEGGDPATIAALAKRIRRDRLDRRMTWPSYAQWMGVNQFTIYKIAMGTTTRPHALTVEKIQAKLNDEPVQGVADQVVPNG